MLFRSNNSNWLGGNSLASHGSRESAGAQFASAFSKTSNAIRDALTIEPKVIPPDDPISLANKPGEEVGSELNYRAARVYEGKNDYKAAIQHYERALQQKPTDVRSRIAIGRLHDRLGNLPVAAENYRQALSIDPENCKAMNDLGICLAKQGQHNEAIQMLQQAVNLKPQKTRYRNNIASVLVEVGQIGRAHV